MPNWSEVLTEIRHEQQKNPGFNAVDTVRRRYLHKIFDLTGRNTIAYYSGWLQKPQARDTAVSDKDKSGFMLTINKLDRSKGLDLILHTPGGDIAATESLVDYLYAMFNKDIRVIVPQISMSAGTMIALASKEIMMGKHSNLGPIDPQIGGLPAQAIIDEFERAKKDVRVNPSSAALWQVIIGKYNPTLLIACEQAMEWSEEIVSKWLEYNMCNGDKDKVKKIVTKFSSHKIQKSHSRHISIKDCKDVGLNIVDLEAEQDLQDAILTTHHVFMHTFSVTSAVKLVENHLGVAYIEQVMQIPPQLIHHNN
jgi:ATP-dependent protease ClpP protease subunit